MKFDILIKNATIVDGTGKPPFRGDIGINDEKIVSIGPAEAAGCREIDGTGLHVCPGFIDMHTHVDVNLMQYPSAENFIMQGVTTAVGGNCGMSSAPMKDFVPWGVFTSSMVGSFWHEIVAGSSGPPPFIPLADYREPLEKRLGFAFDWTSFGSFLDKMDTTGIALNYVPLVGHNSIRVAVMGKDFQRRAAPAEIDEMKRYVAEAMEAGAFGLGAGFDGGPGDFAPTNEVVELAGISREYGGLYASHTRNFDNNYPTADPGQWGYGICHGLSPDYMPGAKYFGLMEAVEVARRAGVSTQIAHICPVYTIYHYYPEVMQRAAAEATLEIIDRASQDGPDISYDLIPDEDPTGVMLSRPALISLFGNRIKESGSVAKFIERLHRPAFRDELRREIMNGRFKFIMIHPRTDYDWMTRIHILIHANPDIRGKTVQDVACSTGRDPFDALFDLIVEDPEARFSCSDPRWTETSLKVFLKHPRGMIGSDLNIVPFGESNLKGGGGLGLGDPGLATYAVYPRFIRRFVREKLHLSIEEAIHKATGLPARKLGLVDRGTIRPGAYADLLLLDFNRIGDAGTWESPQHKPVGIELVMVNGRVVYEGMNQNHARPGKVLRRRQGGGR